MEVTMKAGQYEPLSPEEHIDGISVLLPLHSRNGYVFLIAKTRKIDEQSELLFQLLSDQTHRLAESFGSEANAQHRFEQFLGAMNETLAQYVRDGRLRVPIQQFDAVVGIASDERMFVSGTGDLSALFLHRKPSQRYQIFNLFRSIQTAQALPTWEKAFAVVLDGDLHEGDVFAISNQDLQRIMATDELNNILTTLPPVGSIEKIRQYFPPRTSLLLIVIKMSYGQEAAYVSEMRATPKTNVSVKSFKQQEEATQSLLEDQTPKISTLINFLKRFFKKTKEHPFWRLCWRLGRRWAWNALKATAHLKTQEGRAEVSAHVRGRVRSVISTTRRIIRDVSLLPKSTKYLAGGIAVVIIVLVMGVSTLSASRARSKEQQAYQQQVDIINDLMERASGALIYKDENQARGLFVQANALIEKLPTDTPEHTQKNSELKETIQKSTDEIRHLVNVPNPALLGDLASLTDGVFGQAFVKVGNELFVFASDARIYQLDRTQKVFKPVAVASGGNVVAKTASADDKAVYALMNDQTFEQFVQDESAQKPLGLQKPEGTLNDLVAYAGRLYAIATNGSDGQIYRYTKSAGVFGAPTPWISSKTVALSQATSLAIDGTIYVLQKDGQIRRFDNGAQTEWETGIVDPPLTNATALWTDAQSHSLYVLEPDSKRIVVFEKNTGAFVVQYRSEAFENLTDLIVDEPGYSIYLLVGSKIYSIAPSHIAR
ncbi:hypothetical protein HZA85_00850 [Candidatus Uhrbacteria bacterium]|nr:hypothetical protein [Candidatus Uhrbacteria bacterium]